VPTDWNSNVGNVEVVCDNEQLDIERESSNVKGLEETLGSLLGEKLETALGVLGIKEENFPSTLILTPQIVCTMKLETLEMKSLCSFLSTLLSVTSYLDPATIATSSFARFLN
jgi:hypothetical protein